MYKIQFIALLGFAGVWFPAPMAYAEMAAVTPERQASLCPFLKLTEYHCSDQKPLPADLMDSDTGKSVWADKYASFDKCQLWWWAHYAQQWHYPPLTEWAHLLQDSMREGINISAASAYLRRPPKPPKSVFEGSNVAEVNCRKPSREEQGILNRSLRQFSADGMSSDLLKQLTNYCMAFEVQVPPWKRLGTQLHKAYVIPVGTVNLAVVSELRTWEERSLASVGASTDLDTVNTIVGVCSIEDDPRECLEGLIKPADVNLLVVGGPIHGLKKAEYKMKAIPEGMGLESLYAAHIKKPYDLILNVEDGGNFVFTWKSPAGKVPVELAAFNGELMLSAPNPQCSMENEKIFLRPLSYGLALETMLKSVGQFTKDDFPAPPFRPLDGNKHACNAEPTYGAWAAAVANAARHYALHGVPAEEIFRFIVNQRARWDIENEISPPRSQKDVVYGAFRNKQLETPIFSKTGYEAQAMKFIAGSANHHGKSLLYRTTKIDGIPATEVWYYRNGTRIRPLDPKSPKTNVLLVHNNHVKEILDRSVFARLHALRNNCAPLEEVRGSFIKSMYALFNAVPLQAGEEVVNRAFLSSSYQAVFGERLKDPKKWVNISADAWTMDLDTFAQKYLPML